MSILHKDFNFGYKLYVVTWILFQTLKLFSRAPQRRGPRTIITSPQHDRSSQHKKLTYNVPCTSCEWRTQTTRNTVSLSLRGGYVLSLMRAATVGSRLSRWLLFHRSKDLTPGPQQTSAPRRNKKLCHVPLECAAKKTKCKNITPTWQVV